MTNLTSRLKKYASFYTMAHAERARLFHFKWRLFFVLFTASCLLLIKDYLDYRYPYTVVDLLKNSTFGLSDRIFEWFGLGILFGFLAVSLMHEGEFLLELRRFMKAIEAQTQERVEKGIRNAQRKTATRKKR